MARKTDGEKIDELQHAVALLTERAHNTKGQLASLLGTQSENAKERADLRREFDKEIALMKRELEDLRKWQDEQKKKHDEWSRRIWAFGPNVLGAVVSGIIAAIVAYSIARP